MGNIMFGMLAAPDKHKQIMKEINTWKYDIEGEVCKGKQSPVIHEIKFYEIRIPDELEADVVRDLKLYDIYTKFGTSRNTLMKLVYFAYKTVLFFTPFKALDESKAGDKVKYSLPSTWHYALPLGKLSRKKMKVKFGKDREVL